MDRGEMNIALNLPSVALFFYWDLIWGLPPCERGSLYKAEAASVDDDGGRGETDAEDVEDGEDDVPGAEL